MHQHPIIDVTTWSVDDREPGGDDPKVWLVDPEGRRWLFKPATVRTDRRQGEDWAEKLVYECAVLLDVPAARVELARRTGTPGSLSLNLKPDRSSMHSGAVLISEHDPRIAPKKKSRVGHNLDNIQAVLRDVGAPLNCPGPRSLNAFDVFAGYLVLDAWVANPDRHEENWSVLRDPNGNVTLAPTYDHGSSLGYNLTDSRRAKILSGSPGVPYWARRGRAQRFEDGQRSTLIEFAIRALDRASAGARAHWLEKLGELANVRNVIERCPIVSEATVSFCVELLEENRRRLLDEC